MADKSSLSLLAMTRFRILAARFASELCEMKPSETRGRREDRALASPMARLQKKAGGSHHRSGRNSRPSLRGGFTVYSALSPGTGFLAPVFATMLGIIASATMLVHCAGHQHRDARTTRLGRPHDDRSSASKDAAIACGPPLPASRIVTIARTPLQRGGMGQANINFCK